MWEAGECPGKNEETFSGYLGRMGELLQQLDSRDEDCWEEDVGEIQTSGLGMLL